MFLPTIPRAAAVGSHASSVEVEHGAIMTSTRPGPAPRRTRARDSACAQRRPRRGWRPVRPRACAAGRGSAAPGRDRPRRRPAVNERPRIGDNGRRRGIRVPGGCRAFITSQCLAGHLLPVSRPSRPANQRRSQPASVDAGADAQPCSMYTTSSLATLPLAPAWDSRQHGHRVSTTATPCSRQASTLASARSGVVEMDRQGRHRDRLRHRPATSRAAFSGVPTPMVSPAKFHAPIACSSRATRTTSTTGTAPLVGAAERGGDVAAPRIAVGRAPPSTGGSVPATGRWSRWCSSG